MWLSKETVISNKFDLSNADLSGSNIAIGSSDFTQSIGTPAKGDRETLKQALIGAGVSAESLEELFQAIADDDATEPGQGYGSRVKQWLDEQTATVLPAIATAITNAVLLYHGRPVS